MISHIWHVKNACTYNYVCTLHCIQRNSWSDWATGWEPLCPSRHRLAGLHFRLCLATSRQLVVVPKDMPPSISGYFRHRSGTPRNEQKHTETVRFDGEKHGFLSFLFRFSQFENQSTDFPNPLVAAWGKMTTQMMLCSCCYKVPVDSKSPQHTVPLTNWSKFYILDGSMPIYNACKFNF